MCQQGRSDAHLEAQGIRRRIGASSVQFWPVILSNLIPVLTKVHTWASDLPTDALSSGVGPAGTFARLPLRDEAPRTDGLPPCYLSISSMMACRRPPRPTASRSARVRHVPCYHSTPPPVESRQVHALPLARVMARLRVSYPSPPEG